MKTKQRHARPLAPWARHFEASSVLLFAALTFGTGAVNAQTGTTAGSAGGAGASSSRSATGGSSASPQATFGGGATTQASSASDAAFQRADKDHDGMLSPQEAAQLPAISNRFQALDKNKDQMLSRDEYEAGLKS